MKEIVCNCGLVYLVADHVKPLRCDDCGSLLAYGADDDGVVPRVHASSAAPSSSIADRLMRIEEMLAGVPTQYSRRRRIIRQADA